MDVQKLNSRIQPIILVSNNKKSKKDQKICQKTNQSKAVHSKSTKTQQKKHYRKSKSNSDHSKIDKSRKVSTDSEINFPSPPTGVFDTLK